MSLGSEFAESKKMFFELNRLLGIKTFQSSARKAQQERLDAYLQCYQSVVYLELTDCTV